MAPAQTTYPSRDLASHLDVLFFINLGEQIFTVGVELECPVPIGPGVCRSHGGHLSDEIFVASDERVGSDTGGGAFHLDQSWYVPTQRCLGHTIFCADFRQIQVTSPAESG